MKRPANILLAAALILSVKMHVQAQQAAPGLQAEVAASRPSPYVNEVFELTLSLISEDVRLGQGVELLNGPERDTLVLGNFLELPQQRDSRNGRIRTIRRFRCQARATAPGEIRIAPSLRVTELTRIQMLIGHAWQETPRNLPVRAVTLRVRPLPTAGRPTSFAGAVGSFDFQVEAAPLELTVGDLITVRSTIRGKGFLENVPPPALEAGSHLKTYQPRLVFSNAVTRTYEQTVVPQSAEARMIPSISFCYFDPLLNRFLTRTHGPFTIRFVQRKQDEFQPFRPTEHSGQSPVEAPPSPKRTPSDVLIPMTLLGLGFTAAGVWVALREKRWARAAGWAALMAAVCIGLVAGTRRTGSVRHVGLTTVENARVAPCETSKPLFHIQARTSVRVMETDGDWLLVDDGVNRGWIPAAATEGKPGEKADEDAR